MTAGHCLCGVGNDDFTEDVHLCLETGVNQVTDTNRIAAKWGNKDKRDLPYKHIMDEAWVMHQEKRGETFGYNYDIGLVKLVKKKKLFYDTGTGRTVNVGPICLAARDTDISQEDITVVGWGVRYTETPVKKNNQRKPRRSSCTTNQFSPLGNMFEPCDMQALKDNGWKCNIGTDKVPKGYAREACLKYLQMASEAVGDSDKEEFEQTKQIQLNLKARNGDIIIIRCYKDELFTATDKGWCKITRATGDMDWGFCDTSCQHAFVIISC